MYFIWEQECFWVHHIRTAIQCVCVKVCLRESLVPLAVDASFIL